MRKQKGFNFLEWMIIVAIITLVCALFAPRFVELRQNLQQKDKSPKPYRVYHIYGDFSDEEKAIIDSVEIRKNPCQDWDWDRNKKTFCINKKRDIWINLNKINIVTSELVHPSPKPESKKIQIDKLTIEYKREIE